MGALIPVGIALVFAVIATLGISFARRAIRAKPVNDKRFAIAVVWAIVPGVLSLGFARVGFQQIRSLDRSKWKTVCGVIEGFETQDPGNTGREKFTVKGVSFSYADYGSPGFGYHATRGRGGVLEGGMNVGLQYTSVGSKNVIMRAWRIDDTTEECGPQGAR